MDDLKIISVNVRGLNTYEKRIKVYDWLNDSQIDIAFLQETHYVEKNVSKYDARWFGKSVHSFSDSTFSRGVSVLIRKDLDIEILNFHSSIDGRKLLLNLKFDNNICTIVNIYAPNTELSRIEFFRNMSSYITRHSANLDNLILCGDFDCSFERCDKSTGKLKSILRKLNLIDVWNMKHKDIAGYTWCDASNTPKSRIDFVFISKYFTYDIGNIIVRRIPGTHSNGSRMSDHRLLKVFIKISENNRGPGYWKLNVSYLDNEDYRVGIKNILQNIDDQGNALDTWESFKNQVKDFSVKYSKQKQNSFKKTILSLEKEIEDINDSPSECFNMNRKRELEDRLSTLYDQKCKGAQVRSRSKWINEGEKNTKYFLNLEKRHQSSNVIKELKTQEGNVNNDYEIIGEMCKFYETLYTSKDINDENIDIYLENITVNIIEGKDKELCELFPTVEECNDAVMSLKNNKSPGLDGLPSEFYKCFWGDICTLFYDVLKCVFDKKEMCFTQRMAVVSLIHKKGDKTDLKNYRPLSLTNVDYKIIATIFAHRLQKVIDKLIGKEQSAYIKGRYIGDNARLILDIFEYCEDFNENGILLFLDFEKAFDSVEWNFLFKTLTKFNFGENFLTWMHILYNNPIFRVKNNGWTSKLCKMGRGIRQGCPISALLYLFVAEILAIKIRHNENIEGIKFKNSELEVKSVQHADDLTASVKNDISLLETIKTVEEFCNHAGSKINITKTECILLGPLKGQFDNIHGINVAKQSVKCLGILLGHNKEECYVNNWMKIYHQIEKLFESWKTRKLTIFGKCCLINSLAISKLIYKASILHLPSEEYIKKITRLLCNFVWQKNERIKRNTIIGKIEMGGIGLVDIETKLKALKAAWVTRILNSNGLLSSYVHYLCRNNSINLNFLLRTTERNIKKFSMIEKFPLFYKEVFVNFNNAKRLENVKNLSSTKFLLQPIWNNVLFTYKDKTLFFHNWVKSNILYVKDIFKDDGTLKTLNDYQDILLNKSKWLCEYGVLFRVFKKYTRKFDCSNIDYTNPMPTVSFRLFIFKWFSFNIRQKMQVLL